MPSAACFADGRGGWCRRCGCTCQFLRSALIITCQTIERKYNRNKKTQEGQQRHLATPRNFKPRTCSRTRTVACVYGPYKCPKLTNWLKNHTNQKKGSKKMRSKKIRTRATARSDGGPNHSAIGSRQPKDGDPRAELLLYSPSRFLRAAAIVMNEEFWLQACENALSRSLPQRNQANIAAGSVAVRCALSGHRATNSLLL